MQRAGRIGGGIPWYSYPQVTDILSGVFGEVDRFSDDVAVARQVSAAAGAVMEKEAVERIARRIVRDLGLEASGVRLRVVASEAELPPKIRQAIEEQDAAGEIDGLMHGQDLYVISGRMRAERDIARLIVVHEGYGHWGCRQLHGRNAVRRAQAIYAAVGGNAGVLAFAEQHGVDLSGYFRTADSALYKDDPRGRQFLLVDELLAYVAHHATTTGVRGGVAGAERYALGRGGRGGRGVPS